MIEVHGIQFKTDLPGNQLWNSPFCSAVPVSSVASWGTATGCDFDVPAFKSSLTACEI